MARSGIGWLVAGLLAFGAGVAAGGQHEGHSAPPPSQGQAPAPKEVTVVHCPVTGEEVPTPADAPRSEYKGKTYYFCCAPCKVDFDKDPEKYLKGQK